MKILKGKSKRAIVFSIITIALIIVLLSVNVLATYYGGLTNAYLDLTPEGIYTLTAKMKEECSFVDELGKTDGEKCVKITFCADPDLLVESQLTRPTYYMALELQKKFDNIEVETISLIANPNALAKYKTTSLSTFSSSDIIVSYGDRYRIVSASYFWVGDYEAYDGEYTLATLIKSVTAIEQPAAYFVTGHGELVYDDTDLESEGTKATTKLYELLRAQGMKVGVINLLDEDIPKDAALLVINNPREDYKIDKAGLSSSKYLSEIGKIEQFLINEQGALVVARDYDKSLSLSNLDAFLYEWGFSFGSSVVADPEGNYKGEDTDIVAVYDTDEESYAYQIYGDYAGVGTSAKTVVSNAGYISTSFIENNYVNEQGTSKVVRRYFSFLKSPETSNSYVYTDENGYDGRTYIDKKGSLDIAAVSARQEFDSVIAERTFSFVFCASSAEFFSNELLGNEAYANYDITSALINNISRVDVYASTDLGGTSLNSSSYLGKPIIETTLQEDDYEVIDYRTQTTVGTKSGIGNGEKITFTIIFSLVPLTALSLGIYVLIKRRFL